MNKVAKLFALVLFMVLALATAVNASANDDLLKELSKTYTVGGKEISISAADKVKIERYLADNPVTEAEKDTIISKVNAIVDIMNSENVSDPGKLSAAKKTEAMNLAKEAASAIDLKLVMDTNNNTIKVYDAEGKLLESAKIEQGKLSYTGNSSVAYVVAPVVAIIAVAAVVAVKKVNA